MSEFAAAFDVYSNGPQGLVASSGGDLLLTCFSPRDVEGCRDCNVTVSDDDRDYPDQSFVHRDQHEEFDRNSQRASLFDPCHTPAGAHHMITKNDPSFNQSGEDIASSSLGLDGDRVAFISAQRKRFAPSCRRLKHDTPLAASQFVCIADDFGKPLVSRTIRHFQRPFDSNKVCLPYGSHDEIPGYLPSFFRNSDEPSGSHTGTTVSGAGSPSSFSISSGTSGSPKSAKSCSRGVNDNWQAESPAVSPCYSTSSRKRKSIPCKEVGSSRPECTSEDLGTTNVSRPKRGVKDDADECSQTPSPPAFAPCDVNESPSSFDGARRSCGNIDDNSSEERYGSLDQLLTDANYKWRPGFKLPLGNEGRQKLLFRIRQLHAQDKQWMDRILESNKFPYTKIRYASVEQLFFLCDRLGLWNLALQIHWKYGRFYKRRLPKCKVTNQKPRLSRSEDNCRSTNCSCDSPLDVPLHTDSASAGVAATTNFSGVRTFQRITRCVGKRGMKAEDSPSQGLRSQSIGTNSTPNDPFAVWNNNSSSSSDNCDQGDIRFVGESLSDTIKQSAKDSAKSCRKLETQARPTADLSVIQPTHNSFWHSQASPLSGWREGEAAGFTECVDCPSAESVLEFTDASPESWDLLQSGILLNPSRTPDVLIPHQWRGEHISTPDECPMRSDSTAVTPRNWTSQCSDASEKIDGDYSSQLHDWSRGLVVDGESGVHNTELSGSFSVDSNECAYCSDAVLLSALNGHRLTCRGSRYPDILAQGGSFFMGSGSPSSAIFSFDGTEGQSSGCFTERPSFPPLPARELEDTCLPGGGLYVSSTAFHTQC